MLSYSDAETGRLNEPAFNDVSPALLSRYSQSAQVLETHENEDLANSRRQYPSKDALDQAMAEFRYDLHKADNSEIIERKVSNSDLAYSEDIRLHANSMNVSIKGNQDNI